MGFLALLPLFNFRLMNLIASSLLFLVSLTGVAAAIRQVYLQLNPSPMLSCGGGMEYIFENNSLIDALSILLKPTGSCSDIHWQFLTLTMPQWTLMMFFSFSLLSLILFVKEFKNIKNKE
jgi:disulfide bond formation protein DsbB